MKKIMRTIYRPPNSRSALYDRKRKEIHERFVSGEITLDEATAAFKSIILEISEILTREYAMSLKEGKR